MTFTLQEKTDIKELVTCVHVLCDLDDVPNNPRRDLTDDHVRRLMPESMKGTVDRIKFFLEVLGYDFNTRLAVIEVCKAVGVNVNFVPTEQDCSGWVTAKFITPKGCFHYG